MLRRKTNISDLCILPILPFLLIALMIEYSVLSFCLTIYLIVMLIPMFAKQLKSYFLRKGVIMR